MNVDPHSISDKYQVLKRQLKDYRWLFDTADVAILIIDKDGTYLDYNQAYCRLMGYAKKTKLTNFHPWDVSPEKQADGRDSFEKAIEMIKITIANGKHSFEWLHRRPDDRQFLSHVTMDLIEFDGKKSIRAVLHDISEIRKLERLVEERTCELAIRNKELEQLSSIDALTGVYNRRKFDAILSYAWDSTVHSNKTLAIIYIDVDYFKRFNDHYGHAAGDACLQKIAQLIQDTARRRTDIVARYGGEEFVLIVPDTQYFHVEDLAIRLIDAVNAAKISHHFSDVSSHVTISVGCAITTAGQGCQHATSLLNAADKMLYKAKDKGKNRYEMVSLDSDSNENSNKGV